MENINNNKKSRRKGYEAIILLLLTISLFITATYAWFTDSAYSKGNKIMAGNLYVDVIVNAKEYQNRYSLETRLVPFDDLVDNDKTAVSDECNDIFDSKVYRRKVKGSGEVLYYIATDKEASIVNLFNVEPGQAWPLEIEYMNNGDLALKAAGALKIDKDTNGKPKSYTGIETLFNQLNNNEYVYYNDYAVNFDSNADGDLDTIDPELIKDGLKQDKHTEASYNHVTKGFNEVNNEAKTKEALRRFKKLFALQGGDAISASEYNNLNDEEKTLYTNISVDPRFVDAAKGAYFIDNGGHLEDVLEVYLTKDREEINKGHESEAYFGSLASFELLTTYGSTCDPNFDYDLYTKEDTTKTINALDENIPEEYYMILNESLSANLYNDYQNYLTFASGYCLPKDAITDNLGYVDANGVNVKVYDKDGNIIDDDLYKGVTELGKTFITLYMPTDADSKYQNASISLQLGVTATQVEYEMDDTGYMIYDKNANRKESTNDLKTNDMIAIKSETMNAINPYIFLKVIKSEGDYVTAIMMPVDNIIYYENIANDGVVPQMSTFTGEYSDALSSFGVDYNHFDYSKSNVINYLNDEESKFYKAFKNGFPELYAAIVDEPVIQSLIIPALLVQSVPDTNDFINLTKTNGDYYTIYAHEGFSNYEFIVLGKYESQDKFKFRTASILDMLDYIDTNYITCNEIYELFMGDEVGFNEIEEANTDVRSGGDKLIDNYGQCIGFSDVLLFSGGGGIGLIDKQVDYSFRDNVTYYTNLHNKCAVVPVFTFKNDGSFNYDKIDSLTDFYNDNISEGKSHLSYVDSIEKGQTIDIKLDYNDKSSLVGCRVLDVDENPNGEKIVTVATMIPKLENPYDEKKFNTLPYYGIFGSEFSYLSSNLYANVSIFNNMLKGDENLSSALVELNDYNKTYMFDFTGNAPEVGDRYIVYDNNGLTNNCINKGTQSIAGDDSMPKYARSISMDDLINYYGNESNVDKVDLMIFFRNYDTVDVGSREFEIWLSDADPNSKGRFCVKAIKNDGEDPSKVYINCGESYAKEMYNSFVFKFDASKFKDFVIKKSCENTSDVIIG